VADVVVIVFPKEAVRAVRAVLDAGESAVIASAVVVQADRRVRDAKVVLMEKAVAGSLSAVVEGRAVTGAAAIVIAALTGRSALLCRRTLQ
jgi:hypothetical protein